MTARNFGLCAAALLLSSALFAQQSDKSLTRLFDGDELSENGVADPDAWRERLTQGDLALRETELDRFLAIARRDADARALLSDWAADESAGELAWTARLALRELERDEPLGLLPLGGARFYYQPGQFEDLSKKFEELMESLGAMNMPLHSQPFGGQQGGSGSWSWSSPPSGAAQEHSSRAVELSITPDGVRCKVTEEVDGEQRTSEYEAKTMEELLAAHPELSDTLQVESGDPFKGWSFGHSWPSPMLGRMFREEGNELRTDILGVYVHPLTQEESSRHGLAEGTGLVVDRTMPGTIAATLGIQRGHILLEINDRPVNRHEAISEVLCDRPSDGELRLRIIDNRGRERTCVWRPNGEHDSGEGDVLPRGRQF